MREDDGTERKMSPSLKPASIARIFELAQKHLKPEQWGEWLSTPLRLAGFDGDLELAEELELAGAVGDPLDAAVQGGQLDFVDCHLETAEAGYLNLAVERCHEAMVSVLLARGADPAEMDYGGYFTPLQLAANAGHAGIVGLLLDAGAPVHPRVQKDVKTDSYLDTYETVETESPLDLAAIEGHVDVIKEITQRESSCVNSVSPSTSFTALHYATKHSQLGAMEALVEAGAGLETQGSVKHGTALHVAVGSSDCEPTLLALLRHGAQVDATRGEGVTPLCVAAKAKNRVAVDTLLSAGAEANRPLLKASAGSYSCEMIAYLLERGADVNVKRVSDGNTPLHLAAEGKLKPHINTLLEAGGDETAVNDEGKIPLDMVGRGRRRSSIFDWRLPQSSMDEIRTVLINAPRDRANRAWSRRGFLVLCRALPERLRLQVIPSQDDRVSNRCSAASSASDDASISRVNNKRVATAERGGAGGTLAGAHIDESAAEFRATMSRLMGLEADVVFRTIVEFV